MDLASFLSFDALATSFLICCALRETMVLVLPDHIAGPGGSLVDTGHASD